MITYQSDYRLCFAHRVWCHTQSADPASRMIHGHTASISTIFTYDSHVISQSQVEHKIGIIYQFLDNHVFNRFLIDNADPMFYTLVASLYESLSEECGMTHTAHDQRIFTPVAFSDTDITAGFRVNLEPFPIHRNSPVCDVLRGYFIVDFCPSAPNLARWLYSLVTTLLKDSGINLQRVEWSNTPNRKAVYSLG